MLQTPFFNALFGKMASFGFASLVLGPQSSVLSLYDKITYRDFTNFENGFVLHKKVSMDSTDFHRFNLYDCICTACPMAFLSLS